MLQSLPPPRVCLLLFDMVCALGGDSAHYATLTSLNRRAGPERRGECEVRKAKASAREAFCHPGSNFWHKEKTAHILLILHHDADDFADLDVLCASLNQQLCDVAVVLESTMIWFVSEWNDVMKRSCCARQETCILAHGQARIRQVVSSHERFSNCTACMTGRRTWDSQSMVALSVSTSAITSPAAISCPSSTFHSAMLPCAAAVGSNQWIAKDAAAHRRCPSPTTLAADTQRGPSAGAWS